MSKYYISLSTINATTLKDVDLTRSKFLGEWRWVSGSRSYFWTTNDAIKELVTLKNYEDTGVNKKHDVMLNALEHYKSGSVTCRIQKVKTDDVIYTVKRFSSVLASGPIRITVTNDVVDDKVRMFLNKQGMLSATIHNSATYDGIEDAESLITVSFINRLALTYKTGTICIRIEQGYPENRYTIVKHIFDVSEVHPAINLFGGQL